MFEVVAELEETKQKLIATNSELAQQQADLESQRGLIDYFESEMKQLKTSNQKYQAQIKSSEQQSNALLTEL